MARHADLAAIVERQDGSEAARARVAAFLRMASGEATVEETATALGISTQRLHELRERMVAGAVAAAEPQAPGRPRADAGADPRDARIAELEQQVTRLRFELECGFLRTELAMAFGDRIPSLKNAIHHPDAASTRATRRERRRCEREQRQAGHA
jgi:hypothetical protein